MTTAEERAAQGLPDKVTDPAALMRIAMILNLATQKEEKK